MRTPTTAVPLLGATGDDRDAPIPFSRLFRTELRKLTDTRASRWLVIAAIAITPMVAIATLFIAPARDLTYKQIVDIVSTPERFLLPALGLLSMTSEWSQRTGLITFTLVPDRRRVLAAKLLATLALGAASIAVMFGVAAVANLVGAALLHGNGSWADFGLAGFVEISIVLISCLVQGMAFAMAILVTAGAVIAYYVIPDLVSGLISAIKSLSHSAPWYDLNQAQGTLYNHTIGGTGWIQLLTATLLWIGLPFAVGVLRVSRKEVRSE